MKRRVSFAISLGVILALVSLLLIVTTSCSTITSSIIGGTETGIGRAISKGVEQSVYKKLAPKEQLPAPESPGWGQYMAQQAQVIFSYSFAVGGYWLGQVEYKPGEWTKFKFQEDNEEVEIEKAFLKKLDNGNEWWRISWKDKEDTWIYEALLSPDEGTMLRLRARDTDGNEGEVPVTGDTAVWVQPQKLTKESIEGATVGKETVKTPAGNFEADHVVYMSMTGEGSIEWWLTDKVPGGVVKYDLKDEKGKVYWTAVLSAMGKNATTILKSF